MRLRSMRFQDMLGTVFLVTVACLVLGLLTLLALLIIGLWS